MSVVTIQQAKKNFSQLIKEVLAGETVIITRNGKPVARLEPIKEVNRKRKPGSMKGKFKVGPEFFEPLPSEENWGD